MGKWSGRASARDTGDAQAAPGGYANSGVHIGDVYQTTPPPARSAYLDQVQQIFPWELVGRERELAELTRFATETDGPSYTWWQGPAWAGKSALMAWFVLHPPPGVRMVSFFVTARYLGQSDRNAFLEAVVEQLAEIAEQPMPDLLTVSNRQAWFGRLLREAAAVCGRLVLVVDGLDEDRGADAGQGGNSIAALLPAVPPPGVRVVVAGRTDPPVPADVPARHPLRDPAILRRLPVSPHAQIIRDDAERELDLLLDGGETEHDLVGFVAAAGGGLSGAALAELTGRTEREVIRRLRGVSGRTFQSRAGRWRPGTDANVYVLAHEELQATAVDSLGAGRLARYRELLHTWAADYRRRGWPEETPEYLLRGYFRLLQAAGDVPRMVEFATDPARLDRMLDITGGNAAAATELALAQDTILSRTTYMPPTGPASTLPVTPVLPQVTPARSASLSVASARPAAPDVVTVSDLADLLDLAAVRARLDRRGQFIPSSFPVAWAMLGDVDRAEALARSMTQSWERPDRAKALGGIVRVLVAAGDLDRAERLARPAPHVSQEALAELLRARIEAGEPDRAEDLARALPTMLPHVLSDLADLLVQAGELDRAEDVTNSIADPAARLRPLTALITARSAAGDRQRAHMLARQAEDLIGSLPDAGSMFSRSRQTHVLAQLPGALVASDPERARRLAEEVEETAPSVRSWAGVPALIGLKRVWLALDEPDRARQAVERAEVAAYTADAIFVNVARLAGHASAFAEADEPGLALRLAYRAEQALLTEEDRYSQSDRLALVESLVGMAEWKRAEAVARAAKDQDARDEALGLVVSSALGAGEPARAARLAADVQDADWRETLLSELAESLARSGDLDGAESVARSLPGALNRVSMLLRLVRSTPDHDRARALTSRVEADHEAGAFDSYEQALIRTILGDTDCAVELDRWAEATALSIEDPQARSDALTGLVETLVEAGDPERAEEVARTITDRYSRAVALAWLAADAAGPDEACALAGEAEGLARSLTDPEHQAGSCTQLAVIWATAGDSGRAAECVARAESAIAAIERRTMRIEPLAELAGAHAGMGQACEARHCAERAQALALADDSPNGYGLTLAVTAWDMAGEPDRAAALVTSVTGHEPLARMARVWLARGRTAEAEAIVARIDTEWRRSPLLIELAAAWAAAGDLDRAEAVLGEIARLDEPMRYAQAAVEAVRARMAAGDTKGAARIAEETEAYALSNSLWHHRVTALSEVVKAWVIVGDLERGRGLARRVELDVRAEADPEWQAEALTRLAAALLRADDVTRAETVALAVSDPYWRVEALTSVTLGYVAQGDLDRARVLVGESETALSSLSPPWYRDERLELVTGALAAVGLVDQAWAAVYTASNEYVVDTVAMSLVGRLTTPDDWSRAQEFARTRPPERHPYVLLQLVDSMFAGGDPSGAEAIVRSFTEPTALAYGLRRLGSALAEAGELPKARSVADEIERVAPDIVGWANRESVLSSLQALRARIGDLDRAEAAVTPLTRPFLRLYALIELMKGHAAAGDPEQALLHAERAEAAAMSMLDSHADRGFALRTLAREWAGLGDLNRAEAIASSFPDLDWHAEAPAWVAEEAAESDPVRARRLLATALARTDDYCQLLGSVARVAPEILHVERDRLVRWGLVGRE
ncbi:hypothetical protein AB0L53_44225 [Nonomuraea sp. NPDC052129]|uniref:hypothetical protein n=1 Tax=Nonomuraea sp. NPDC052129 TaxID=3154651 RepID=UPI0034302FF6